MAAAILSVDSILVQTKLRKCKRLRVLFFGEFFDMVGTVS